MPGLEDTTMRMTYSLPPWGSQSNWESRKINTPTEKPRDNIGTKIFNKKEKRDRNMIHDTENKLPF